MLRTTEDHVRHLRSYMGAGDSDVVSPSRARLYARQCWPMLPHRNIEAIVHSITGGKGGSPLPDPVAPPQPDPVAAAKARIDAVIDELPTPEPQRQRKRVSRLPKGTGPKIVRFLTRLLRDDMTLRVEVGLERVREKFGFAGSQNTFYTTYWTKARAKAGLSGQKKKNSTPAPKASPPTVVLNRPEPEAPPVAPLPAVDVVATRPGTVTARISLEGPVVSLKAELGDEGWTATLVGYGLTKAEVSELFGFVEPHVLGVGK